MKLVGLYFVLIVILGFVAIHEYELFIKSLSNVGAGL